MDPHCLRVLPGLYILINDIYLEGFVLKTHGTTLLPWYVPSRLFTKNRNEFQSPNSEGRRFIKSSERTNSVKQSICSKKPLELNLILKKLSKKYSKLASCSSTF
jgi:hypothetical protein